MGKIKLLLNKSDTIKEKMAYWVGKRPKYQSVSESGILHGYNANDTEMAWFDDFIQCNILGWENKCYNLYGVFGSKIFCKLNKLPHSIFYSGETVHTGKLFLEYDDYCLQDVDLSMTFDRVDAPNYLRLPQWIIWLFKPILDKDYISERVKEINAAKSAGREEAVIISNHDGHKTRGPICDALFDILKITYGGRWRNNTRALWDEFDDDKIRFLHEFKFNICPENRNVKDYVTEKIFEAFAGGVVPIYYGSDNAPEPGIVNPKAILFWDLKHPKNNDAVKAQIKAMNGNEALRRKFLSQEKLLPYTVDFVYDTLCELKRRLEII